MSPANDEPRDRVAGHIRILGSLGVGGMGEVFVGFDERLQRRVALKTIHAQYRLDPAFKARFLREARILSRLDHPNICRIHDYVEGTDRDFLVLEMVEGETLQKRLETGLEEGRKLSIAEQVAEALAAAHARGVVHRDLKPGNVMLTADGGVKILDFGIARPAPDSPPAAEAGPGTLPEPGALPRTGDETVAGAPTPGPHTVRSDDATVIYRPPDGAAEGAPGGEVRTRLGVLVGTPAYMSPEQARLEPATTASDMYSFGLLLQELFTGETPYPPDLDAAALVARARRGETLPVEGLDRDLTALVSDLLEPAPAERPTAAATLRRLRWIQGKPRRRLLRLAAAGVVALLLAAGTKYTLDLKAARDVADRHRAQAEDLIGFMLGDLRGKLEGVGRLDLLEDVGDKALDYFESLPIEDRTPDELFRRSEALRQIGEVRIGQGDLDAAASAFDQSLRLSEDLAAGDETRARWLLGLAHSHFWIGNVEWLRGDLDAALGRFDEYRRIAERLAAAEPEETEWRLETAYAYSNLAAVHDAQGHGDLALDALRRSIDLKEDLVARDPDNAEWRSSLANGLSWQGSQLEERGNLAGALESFETEERMRRVLADEDPRNAEVQYLLAANLSHSGRLRLLLGDLDRAGADLGDALDLCKGLVARDPTNLDWKRNLGVAHRDLGELRRAAGEAGDAGSDLETAGRIFEELIERDPSNTDWQNELILTHLLSAEAALARRQAEAAEVALDRAEELLGPRLAAQPEHRDSIHYRAWASLLRGRALALQGLAGPAHDALEAAHHALAPIAEGSRDVGILDTWARVLLRTDRRAAATEVVKTLLATGYRRPDFLACCASRQYLDTPADAAGASAPAAGPASHPNPLQ